MQSAELKTFENMSEGIVIFNEDGSFDYINEVAAEWLWGHREDDVRYDLLAGIVRSVINDASHRAVMVTLKVVVDSCEIKCAVSIINGHILVVLDKSLDSKARGFGMPSPLEKIREKLHFMNSVYVGGRPVMEQDDQLTGVPVDAWID